MSRSIQELKLELEKLKAGFEKDFDEDYDMERLKPALAEMLHLRIKKFLERRIGHFQDFDLIAFYDVFLDNGRTPIPETKPAPAPQVEYKKPQQTQYKKK